GLPYLAGFGAAMALRHVSDARAAAALRAYGRAVAAATLAAFLGGVGPDRWTHSACDAIAVNLVAAVVVGGLALALLSSFRGENRMMRAAAVAAAGIATFAVFAAGGPRCPRGPHALIGPAVSASWLHHLPPKRPLLRPVAP